MFETFVFAPIENLQWVIITYEYRKMYHAIPLLLFLNFDEDQFCDQVF